MVKNTKRAMSAFINFAAGMNGSQLVAFLATHGFAFTTWANTLTDCKTLAGRIGAVEALAQAEAIRKAAADALRQDREAMLSAARESWVNGNPRAFDGINW